MSAKKVIVHIGYPKCASSSIQAFFADNHRQHVKAGVCYPASGRSPDGYRSHDELFRKRLADDELRTTFDEIEEEARNCRTLVLSSEAGIGKLRDPHLLRRCMVELERRYGADNTTVLIVVRNHFELAESSYAQFIRGGLYGIDRKAFFRRRSPSIARYYDRIFTRDGYYPFSYQDTVDAVRAEIGHCGLKIMSMHPADVGDSPIDRIAALVGVEPPDQAATPVRNTRFSTRALLAMSYAYAHHDVGDVQARGSTISHRFGRAEDDGWSKSLHGGKRFVDIVRESQERDRPFFASLPGCFDAVLSEPDLARPGTEPTPVELSQSDRAFVDALFTDPKWQRFTPRAVRNAWHEFRVRRD